MPPIAIDSETLTCSFNVIAAMSDSIAGDQHWNAPEMDSSMAEVSVTMDTTMKDESGMAVVAPDSNLSAVLKEEEETDLYRSFLNDLNFDESVDLTAMNVVFDGLGIDCVGQQPPEPFVFSNPCQEVDIPGLRNVPCPTLHCASKGEDKSKSAKNDNWSLRRADQLRSALGWDMRIPFGDLPFKEIDQILSNFFSRAVKMNGEDYPSATIQNMVGGFNRIIRRASECRSLRGDHSNKADKSFCIKKHAAFVATRLTIRAAVQKTARDGNNKKTKKVEVLTQCMEDAILADVDHQITSSVGVQKRLVLYLMTRCGIRGGDELWELMRCDLTIQKDCRGREYVKFEERRSKNNEYNENRTNENQFRTTYYSYEPDFMSTAKQYLRHLPELGDGVKPDLILQPIPSPASIVWNNRVHKVAKDNCMGMLKGMLKIVGLPTNLIHNYSNKSGRATLVTRMAARGVPDETGRLVTGHHTTSGYANYDRTSALKQEAAVLVSGTPGLTYEAALKEVSANFVQEKVIGTFDNLNPLMDAETATRVEQLKRRREHELQQAGKKMVTCHNQEALVEHGNSSSEITSIAGGGRGVLEAWHRNYDQINWEEEIKNNPVLARALGGSKSQVSNVANHMAGIYSNCNITIHVVQPGSTEAKGKGKENEP